MNNRRTQDRFVNFIDPPSAGLEQVRSIRAPARPVSRGN
jgi:hypothetical protein